MSRYNKAGIIEHYDQFYAEKGFSQREFQLYQKYLKLLQLRTSFGKAKTNRLFDLGCGYGVKTLAFGAFYNETLAVDLSSSAIEVASRINTNTSIRFVCDDIFNITENNFDTISALGFSFFNEEDSAVLAPRLADIADRFLAPNGRLILSSQTDFSGTAIGGWVMHSQQQLDELINALAEKGYTAELYFPQRDRNNFTGFGFMNWLKESVKYLKSKRRIYFLVLSKAR